MLLQNDHHSCGVYAIVNACLALGHDHTLQIDQIRQWAGTTKAAGTSEQGITRALQMLEYSVEELRLLPDHRMGPSIQVSPKRMARDAITHSTLYGSLYDSLQRGQSSILCVDGEDHWVAVVGSIGTYQSGRLVIFDSQRDRANDGEESGVLVYDKREFDERLGGSHYALTISDRPEETDSLGDDVSSDVMSSILGLVQGAQGQDVVVKLAETEKLRNMPNDLSAWLFRGQR